MRFFDNIQSLQDNENIKLQQDLEQQVQNPLLKKKLIVQLTLNKNADYLEKVLALSNIRDYLTPQDICFIAAAKDSCCRKIIAAKVYQEDSDTWNKIIRLDEVHERLSLQKCPNSV